MKTGINEIWKVVLDFMDHVKASEVFLQRRRQQTLSWVYTMVEDHLREKFYRCPAVEASRDVVEQRVVAGELSATGAAQELLRMYEGPPRK